MPNNPFTNGALKFGNSNINVSPNSIPNTLILGSDIHPIIERIGDLVNPKLSFSGNNFVKKSDFQIDTNRIQLDPIIGRVLSRMNIEMRSIALEKLPNQDEILSLNVGKLLTDFRSANKQADGLKKDLQADGHTGELMLVAKKLNKTRLSPIDREILSREGLLMYHFYRAVVGHNVEDIDGIVSGVMSSLGKVKATLHRAIGAEIVRTKNLIITSDELKSLQDQLENQGSIPYDAKNLESFILSIYNKVKSGGGLFKEINQFLDSGLVKVPEGLSRTEIVERMVNFLVEIGYTSEEEVEEDLPTQLPKDNLGALYGIDAARASSLGLRDIRTFSQIAQMEIKDLQEIMPELNENRIMSIIEQSRLASEGLFQDLIDYIERASQDDPLEPEFEDEQID